LIYPNPVLGPIFTVIPPSYSGLKSVEVELFTIAFRKIQDKVYSNLASGTPLQMEATDRWGSPLANGLYYVVVKVAGARSVGKIIVLR